MWTQQDEQRKHDLAMIYRLEGFTCDRQQSLVDAQAKVYEEKLCREEREHLLNRLHTLSRRCR